ncbi:hypothetical protein ATANTOWER_029735 [Ataeniobius toweri]|uniref:Uncharacterized protein n=1 Tax=Ataeniobius toweri TaxID=208326 RepID=A0ABU7BTQ3_9TELE|nr:hypothetical protein [Ataeniobius toweri]
MQQIKFRSSILSCSSSHSPWVDPLYNVESAGLRLRSSDSSVASFSVRCCSLVFCEETTPFLPLAVFIAQIASLLIPCCRASYPNIDLHGCHDFSVLSLGLH